MKAEDPLNVMSQDREPSAVQTDGRLHAIFEIATILATDHDLNTMAPKLLQSLLDSLPMADAGLLMLYDQAAGYLRIQAARGYDAEKLQALRLAPGESITGQVFFAGRPAVYETAEATVAAMSTMTPANLAIFRAATEGMPLPCSAICIPLTADGVKVGVLLLENFCQHGRFVAGDLAFLERVGDLLALAIDNARLRGELELAQSRDEANRLKAEVISTLAHELRTPLTSIKGYSSALLMDELAFGPETQREFLGIIDEQCDVLQDLIHDLLESSIIDAGFLRLEFEPLRVPILVREIVGDMAHLGSRHRFMIDFHADFPLVDADPHRVRQVLRNLIDNAVKYSADESLVVVQGAVQPGEVVISVADQGVGLAPEHLNRLFEKFFRVKSGLGRHVAGTGLGLPIARAIVESHGGRIWAESQVGQGTTLYFTLPLKRAPQDQGEDDVV